jgi:hypothetical protein
MVRASSHELLQLLHALRGILQEFYDTLLDEEKLAGHLLITHRQSPITILDEDDDQRFTTHLRLHGGTTQH